VLLDREGSDGGALADASCDKALTGEMLRPECGRRPIQIIRVKKSDAKSPRPVSRRGLNCCEDDNVPVICPTCQICFAGRGLA